MNFADVILDDLPAGDVLEYDARECEIKLPVAEDGKVHSVVLVYVRVRAARERLSGAFDHLAADIDAVNLAENPGKSSCDPPCPAADLEHLHLLRIPSLADIRQIGQDLLGHRLAAGFEELLVRPLFFSGSDVVAGVLAGPLIPVALHLLELVFQAEILHSALF